MKKCKIYNLVILILSIQNSPVAQEIELLKTKHFPNYPSASTLAFYNNRIYVIGDDAPHMLILDTGYKILDSIRLFTNKTRRIDKDAKADIESSFLFNTNNKLYLIALSSFSSKNRNSYIAFDLSGNGKKSTVKKQRNFLPNGINHLNIKCLPIQAAPSIFK